MNIDGHNISAETECLVREVGIPPCPQVLIDFMREVRSDDSDLSRVSHLISKDVGLAAAVLTTANSAFYGLRHKAKSVHSALFALGLRNAANLIAGLMLRRSFASMDPRFMNDFWDSSSRIGLLAALFGRELGVTDIHQAHTYGLFRDCGLPLLAKKYPDRIAALRETHSDRPRHVTEVEHQQFGIDHASIGASLAMSWYLPDEISGAIQQHHAPQAPAADSRSRRADPSALVALGTLAEAIYRQRGNASLSEPWMQELENACVALGVRMQDIEPLHPDVNRILDGN